MRLIAILSIVFVMILSACGKGESANKAAIDSSITQIKTALESMPAEQKEQFIKMTLEGIKSQGQISGADLEYFEAELRKLL